MNESPSFGRALSMTITLLACVFGGLGVLFALAPAPAATFYGIDAGSSSGLFYVRAVGFRDLALAAYLFGLTLARQFRALSIVMFATLVIPIGDILLLAASGRAQPVHYLLHAASFCAPRAWLGGRDDLHARDDAQHTTRLPAATNWLASSSWRRLPVLGGTDVGKSSFLRFLARVLAERGQTAALLDTDLGQKMVGPPACIVLAQPPLPEFGPAT